VNLALLSKYIIWLNVNDHRTGITYRVEIISAVEDETEFVNCLIH
jgi:hypothetical protein